MGSWRYSVGNLARRAPAAPAAVAPAAADTDLPLTNLANDYPDLQAALQWRSDGSYGIEVDLNLLADSSSRADAPTGWGDLLLLLAGTPGLPANAPDWGTYAGRTALRAFRPVVQEVEVMPGETVQLELGLYLPAASAATGARVRVVDLSTGKAWEASSTDDWADGGIVAEQTVDDTWLDVSVTITADAARAERSRYQVILEPEAAAFDATTYVYASAYGASGSPALFAEVDLAAIIGHNLPAGATVTMDPQPSGTALTLTPAQPSVYTVADTPVLVQVWRLSITMPLGNQPRPILGELWVGKARTLLVGSPVLPIGLEESSPGQISVESGRGRVEKLGEDARPAMRTELAFRARTDAAYRQLRDEVARLTRFGADPLLIFPNAEFDGAGRVYHLKMAENRVRFDKETPDGAETLWSFSIPFIESPFAAA